MLFVFKYFNFFNENIVALANFLHWNYSVAAVSIILPLGLSFHVFQSLSYVIEVYRGKFKAENNFFTYALYVMFFPQLVAGPIERPGHLLPQLNMTHNFNATNVRRGLERMLWGFFKKLVIADQIAIIVNHLYTNLPYDGPTLLLLMFLFTYQLYCDFSGYSDIAIGSAMVLGFNLVENFNRPFASQSIAEYWRRWHISLSSWLRDYLYYPMVLGFGKVSKIRLYLSLFITFTLIGLWHGANWTFVIMGAMHGFYLVFASLTENVRQKFATVIGLTKFPKIRRLIKILIVFFLVSLGNIFFRAENVGQAWQIISHLGDNFLDIFNVDFLRYQIFTEATLGVWKSAVVVIVLAIVFMEVIQFIQKYKKNIYIFEEKTKAVRYGWYYVLTLTILFFGYFGAQPFVYFKF
ncbi:MAG: MBOAT family O-acyltransferase [bacterium]|nr:MBOAT family O-acyltransferase [bacterium]